MKDSTIQIKLSTEEEKFELPRIPNTQKVAESFSEYENWLYEGGEKVSRKEPS